MESVGRRNTLNIKMSIELDTSAIASFYWGEEQANKIRQAREKAGYSRPQLAEKSGVSVSYIQQMETPRLFTNRSKKPKDMTVTKETLRQICQALDVDMVSLIWDFSSSIY